MSGKLRTAHDTCNHQHGQEWSTSSLLSCSCHKGRKLRRTDLEEAKKPKLFWQEEQQRLAFALPPPRRPSHPAARCLKISSSCVSKRCMAMSIVWSEGTTITRCWMGPPDVLQQASESRLLPFPCNCILEVDPSLSEISDGQSGKGVRGFLLSVLFSTQTLI